MRRAVVPVDTVSEQKTILGVVSVRQLIIIGIGIYLYYLCVPILWGIFTHWLVSIFVVVIGMIPFLVLIWLFAFKRVKKYHMYFDLYLAREKCIKRQAFLQPLNNTYSLHIVQKE